MAGVSDSVENLVKILRKDQNWAIFTTGMSDMGIELGLSRLQIIEIRYNPLKNRSEKPSIGHECPWVFG